MSEWIKVDVMCHKTILNRKTDRQHSHGMLAWQVNPLCHCVTMLLLSEETPSASYLLHCSVFSQLLL